MTPKPWPVAAILALAAPPAIAQDLPADQLERHAEVVRQDMLVKSTMGPRTARGDDRTSRATPRQAAACASKARFRGQYGADHPKVRTLYRLCRNVGL